MQRKLAWHSSPPNDFASLSALVCLLGVLLFLAVTVAAGSLSKALASLRINIEGFEERDRAPILLECLKDEARSLDGRYSFLVVPEDATLKMRKWSATPFTEFLAGISKEGGSEYVLFLVRPEGINTFKVLRDVLVLRNDSVCTVSVPFAASTSARGSLDELQGLPKDLRKKIQLESGKLSFAGRMSASERDTLAQVLGQATRPQVDALFDRSQRVVACVDHGAELLPTEWKFENDEQGHVRLRPGLR